MTAEQLANKLEKLLAEYKQKVIYLETENKILKEVLQEQNVKIPMDKFKTLQNLQKKTATLPNSPSTTSSNQQKNSSVTVNLGASTAGISNSVQLGFINQIHKDWENIKPFYKIRPQAVIGGYEFVQSGNNDNVYVDILYYGNTLSGSYDAKLLYQFDKNTFKRTLVGFFVFDRNTGWYITKKGKNPFSKENRQFVADPYLVRTPPILSIPENANIDVNTSGNITTQNPSVNTQPQNTVKGKDTNLLSQIRQAYTEDKYTLVLAKTDEYLKKFGNNLEVLSIRYRTYFIIAQYDKALAIIKNMENKGQMSNRIACDAYAIATYAKKTALASKYKKRAGSLCEVLR